MKNSISAINYASNLDIKQNRLSREVIFGGKHNNSSDKLQLPQV